MELWKEKGLDKDFDILSPYVNAKTRVKIQCKSCGKIINAWLYDYLVRGTKCTCKNDRPLQEIFDMFNKRNGYEVYTKVGSYTGYNDKVEIKCNKCGHTFNTTANYLKIVYKRNKYPYQCEYCNNNYNDLDSIDMKDIPINEHTFDYLWNRAGLNDRFDIIDKISNKYTKVKCKSCGKIYDVYNYDYIKRNRKCECQLDHNKELNTNGLSYYKGMMMAQWGRIPYIFKEPYINSVTPVLVECKDCHKTSKILMSNVIKNIKNDLPYHVCKYCNVGRGSTKYDRYDKKLAVEEYTDDLNKIYGKNNSYDLLEYLYQNNTNLDAPLLHKCQICGYKWKIAPASLLSHTKEDRICPNCNGMVQKFDDVTYREWLKKNYPEVTLLEKYKGRRTKIKHHCSVCNKNWIVTPNNILLGNHCYNCSKHKNRSHYEDDIKDMLIEHGIDKNDIVLNNRQILNGKELDIYLPKYKLAIEVNGLYWHSDKYKDKNYHLNKLNECQNLGITLLQFYDDTLINHKDIVYDYILYHLNLVNNKVYARNTVINTKISHAAKNKFLDKNHIQGHDISSISIGLSLKDDPDKIVAIMTFSKPRNIYSTKNMKNMYELSRYATLIDHSVVGGFSKLLKYFNTHYNSPKILTFANKNFSTGNLYTKNGFVLDHTSKPSYFYVDANLYKRYHRYNYRKGVLKKKFPDYYKDDLTEFEIMDNIPNFYRIWNTGNNVYLYNS